MAQMFGSWVMQVLDQLNRGFDRLAQTCNAGLRKRKAKNGQSLPFETALNNMTQGLCMYDSEQRLILCNRRYAQMYKIPPELTKQGTPYRQILEHRTSGKVSPDEAVAEIARYRTHARTITRELDDGRIIAVSHHPIENGGWFSIHEDVTELRRAEKTQQEAHALLVEVTEAITAGVIVHDEHDRLVLRNRRCEEIYIGTDYLRTPGASFEDTLRYGVAHGTFLDAIGREEEWIAEQIASREQQVTHDHPLSNGRWVRYYNRRMSDGGYITTAVDITQLKRREEELKVQNARFIATIENMAHGICMFDKDLRLIVCNQRYSEMYGLTPDQTRPGTALRSILEARVAVGNAPDDVDSYVEQRLQEVRSQQPLYMVNHMRDGRVFAISHQPMADGGCVAIHQDITEQKRAEMQIAYMARHDALTGLANRAVLMEKMEGALALLRRRSDEFMVFILDLDLFKTVNDTLGHPVGDALLKVVAHRLSACTRETDTVARLGGDEFAIVATAEGKLREAAMVMASKVLDALAAPYEFDGHHIVIGVSVGIALAPEHGSEVDHLMKNADLALYKAKSDGRNTYRFFEDAMTIEVRTRSTLQTDLRNAVANEEFELHYQPIVEIESGEVASVEALVRWRHPQRGLLAPGDFIPLAEETGFINPLGEWILRKACTDAAQWPSHINVSVNLSPVQFRKASLIDMSCRALADSGLPPERLELEVAESVVLRGSRENVETLHQLRLMGISIVLDDFGTGYSSLSYLRMFPFSKIKIDRSFVHELSRDADSASIVSSVACLARSLRMGTVAEGVETQDQLVLLRAAGCTYAQGFFFARPCPAIHLKLRPFGQNKQNAKRARN
jgi:diguanylate cyclase (GGDEF)-like protein/PAS domain S-box-containing protein